MSGRGDVWLTQGGPFGRQKCHPLPRTLTGRARRTRHCQNKPPSGRLRSALAPYADEEGLVTQTRRNQNTLDAAIILLTPVSWLGLITNDDVVDVAICGVSD